MSAEQTNDYPDSTGQPGAGALRRGAKKWIAVGAAGVALAVGSLAVSMLSPLGSAGAQETEAADVDSTAKAEDSTVDSDKKAEKDCDGKRKSRGKFKGDGSKLTVLAEALGMTADEVAEALRGGQTVADLAGDKADEVIDALVQNATEQIQAKVADGSLDQDKADEMIASLEEKITAFVNGEHPEGIERGGKGRFGPRGFPKDGAWASKSAKTAA